MLAAGALAWIACRPVLKMCVSMTQCGVSWLLTASVLLIITGVFPRLPGSHSRGRIFCPPNRPRARRRLFSWVLKYSLFQRFGPNASSRTSLYLHRSLPKWSPRLILLLFPLSVRARAHVALRSRSDSNRFGGSILRRYCILPGPIILILTLYQLYGFCLAFLIKQIFWVPHRFRHGIYVAAGWGNYGELRTSAPLPIQPSTSDTSLSYRCDAYNHVRYTVSRSEGH